MQRQTVFQRVRRTAATAAAVLGLLLPPGMGLAWQTVPEELFEALGIERDAPANVLYDAVAARYYDEAQGYGRGQFADLWEPIAFSQYMDPNLYQPREHLDFDVTAEE